MKFITKTPQNSLKTIYYLQGTKFNTCFNYSQNVVREP